MKKFLSAILAMTLLVVMAVPVCAEGEITTLPDSSSTQVVTADYDTADTPTPGTVYYVTVEWTANQNTITFTKGTAAYKWNGSTMKYEADTAKDVPDKWNGEAQYTVKVTNQSNGTIKAEATWQAADGITATANVDKSLQLTTAAVTGTGETKTDIEWNDTTTEGTAQTDSIVVNIATPTAGTITAENKTVGTITVTISAVTE